ncbi:hypothetical protein [Levilactobacillus brevis]|uniref:hypothetical protein n=1 Tax=Levilactobacillus brevis TaxID=1580 RepID=UPI002072C688|nr:hypothetical protein [Levilactobacillus brevis]
MNTAHAASSTADVTTSVSSSSNNATSSVSGTDDTSASSAGETAISSAATNTSSENSDRVEYGVRTVEQAIEAADNSQVVENSNGTMGIMTFSAAKSSRPNSLAAYKKLGYKHITYSKWSGTHNYAGTKAKRIAAFTAEQLAGLAPGAGIKVALFAYDVADAFKTKKADIWPIYNIRLVSATAPRGNRAIIGQESVVKYYSNSKRTHLVKTIHRTAWVG